VVHAVTALIEMGEDETAESAQPTAENETELGEGAEVGYFLLSLTPSLSLAI
jgi:hypothetical protein